MEQKIDLRSALQELGINNIFTNDADLSGMTGPPIHAWKYETYSHVQSTKNPQVDTGHRRNELKEGFSAVALILALVRLR